MGSGEAEADTANTTARQVSQYIYMGLDDDTRGDLKLLKKLL